MGLFIGLIDEFNFQIVPDLIFSLFYRTLLHTLILPSLSLLQTIPFSLFSQIKPESTQLKPVEDTTDAAPASDKEDDADEVVEEWVDVPYQYQVEEVQQKDSVVEEVVEKKVPQVKAMYPYSGHGMNITKGEVRDKICLDDNIARIYTDELVQQIVCAAENF